MRFTETTQEMDTLTVSSEFVKDPERFIDTCSAIVGSNFLRVPPEFTVVAGSAPRIRMKVPIWFNGAKFNSLAKWLVMFIERAVWIHFFSSQQGKRDFTQLVQSPAFLPR